ncbi:serine/threonine-protein kinase [Szabonella alba]|uniref:Protein kinase n=1 Tax=Szabonella alba TaxID=2804194 RepID=A0A8K0VA57_9RHOB|nr:serine/threonine-protein kinase [Szabonella alba]MBL4917936.1 protein kinase [Szabonella alba]
MAEEKTPPPENGQSDSGGSGRPSQSSPPQGTTPPVTVTSGMLVAGTYEIEQLINRGGMGEVYRGRNVHTGDPVAMKIVLPALAHDPMIEALFQKEAKVLGRLAHDAIVRYHTYMNPPEIGRPSLIMEFVEGKSLSDRIKEEPLSEAEVRILLRRLASGLDRAHGAGVVHRDLSPDNVLLEGQKVENAKLIDFGIAKSSMKGDRTLLQGQFAGKFSFVAPEQLGAFDGAIDGRTDVYSLALMMVAACRGKNLNMGGSIIEAVRSRSSVPDLDDVYAGLRPLLQHMLQPDPANRPASMARVIELLDDPSQIPVIAPDAGSIDPDRTVIAGGLPRVTGGAAPAMGGTASPEAQAQFVGIPGSKGSGAPAPAKKSGKGGLIAAGLVMLLALGGGAAWMTGTFDPEPAEPEATAQDEGGSGATGDGGTQPPADTAEGGTQTPEDGSQSAANETDTTNPETDAESAAETEGAETQPEGGETGSSAETETAEPAPPLDALGRQLAWLDNYDAGNCVYLSRLDGDGSRINLEGFGTSVDPFTRLLADFRAAHGVEPDIGVRLINDTQCPVLDFLNGIRANRGIPPSLVLDNASDVLKSGETVSGRVEGLAGRAVSLFLVNGAGGATNLKPWLSRASDGTLGFSFTVNLAAGAEPTPQMILAVVTERSVDKLDAVPNGVTARALVPFMRSELERERQSPIGALRFFRLEN